MLDHPLNFLPEVDVVLRIIGLLVVASEGLEGSRGRNTLFIGRIVISLGKVSTTSVDRVMDNGPGKILTVDGSHVHH